jgi:hypothetical protein
MPDLDLRTVAIYTNGKYDGTTKTNFKGTSSKDGKQYDLYVLGKHEADYKKGCAMFRTKVGDTSPHLVKDYSSMSCPKG